MEKKKKKEIDTAKAADSPRANNHVLVVDDEKLMLYSLEFLLVQAECRVTLLDSAKDALDLLRRQPEAYGLLILDLVLAEFSGIELIDALDRLDITIPIIVITGYATPEIESKLRNSNIIGYLNKPFQYGELLEMVGKVLDISKKSKYSKHD